MTDTPTLALAQEGMAPIHFKDAAELVEALRVLGQRGDEPFDVVGPPPFRTLDEFDVPPDAEGFHRLLEMLPEGVPAPFLALAMARRGYPLLALRRTAGQPDIATSVADGSVYAWRPISPREAVPNEGDIEDRLAAYGHLSWDRAVVEARRECLEAAATADDARARAEYFLADVPAVALLGIDGAFLAGPRDGIRTVPVTPAALEGVLKRKRGWQAALAHAELVARLLYPEPPVPEEYEKTPPARPWTAREQTLVALTGLHAEAHGRASRPLHPDEYGDEDYEHPDRPSSPNASAYGDALAFARLLEIGDPSPEHVEGGIGPAISFGSGVAGTKVTFWGNGDIEVTTREGNHDIAGFDHAVLPPVVRTEVLGRSA